MSTVLEHSASASTTVEYKYKLKHGKAPSWIKQKNIGRYYDSMSAFYNECLDEIQLQKRFDKKELHTKLMARLRDFIREDNDFASLLHRIAMNYPRFPMDAKQASEYIICLRNLSARVADTGMKANDELAVNALASNAPFVCFSNLYLGNYTISYFHEYKAKMTEQYFRHNHLLVRGRTNLKTRRTALENYFNARKPAEDLFKILNKEQFKLWLFIALANFEKVQDFPQNPSSSGPYEIDQKQLKSLQTKQEHAVEKLRYLLYDLEPTLFNPTTFVHEATETMWKAMILVRSGQ